MFNANDISMNGTCDTYVQYSATKSHGARAQCNAILDTKHL